MESEVEGRLLWLFPAILFIDVNQCLRKYHIFRQFAHEETIYIITYILYMYNFLLI